MSTYEATVKLLQGLSEEELAAIQVVARAFQTRMRRDVAEHGRQEDNFYTPMTEAQLLERIDVAIEQSKQGLGEDAHKVAADLRAEFGR